MSVTFSHTAEPVISGWYRKCGCGEYRSEEYADYNTAATGENGCMDESCVVYPTYATPVYVGVEPISANFSNVNARHLLTLLGIDAEEDLCGSMDVDKFELALTLAVPTAGIPDRTTVTVGGESVSMEGFVGVGGAFIECGRDAGYDSRAIDALREVIEQAKELHAEQITWG